MGEKGKNMGTKKLELKRTMIVWNPETDQVKVGPHPDRTDWSRGYVYSDGACWSDVKKLSRSQANSFLLNLYVKLVVLYEIDPFAAYKALSNIEGFTDGLPVDMPVFKDIKDFAG